MTPTELAELLRNGEDSALEFKRDDVPNHELARELVAFLNLEGGTVLLGIEDDGGISGTTRPRLDEWVSELCRTKIEPPVVPLLSWLKDAEAGRDVLAVRVTLGPNKPYARVHDGRKTYFIRVNNTVREASREELERMFQASGRLHYGLKPVPGADFGAFDLRRLRDYFTRVLRGSAPADDELLGWETLLTNVELMTESAGQRVATIDGMLLFGRATKRFVPQSGIRAICYPGSEPDYATRADEDLRGPMLPLASTDASIIEPGLLEQALDFVKRNTAPSAQLEGGRRIDRWEFPESVVREALVNALVHRDYSIAGTDILIAIFEDRLEVQSPGRLPNTVTLEGMKAGMRYARNQTLVNVMRDYGYVDARGMGVRNKIIPGMRAHNGTEPDILAEESRVTIRLWKRARPA
jgi:ATP-dependent DNA helicase RecG